MRLGRKHNVTLVDDGPDTLLARPPLFSNRPWEFTDSRMEDKRAPKETLVALTRKFTMEAVLTLVHHMRNSRDPEISIKAAPTLLDRGWGKAAEIVGIGNANGALADLTSLPIDRRIEILEAAAAGHALPASAVVDAVLEPTPDISDLLD